MAGLSTPLGTVRNCNWSYQWAEHGRLGARHCDIVLEYEDGAGRGILVVEAKRPGNKLGEKDLDPAYYLDIPELAAYERRSLVYLVDDAARARGEEIVRAAPFDVGFLSWVQLADLQIDLAGSLALPEEVRAFVAGSLYQTFGVRGIEPTVTPLDYLEREPPAEDVVNKRAGRTLGEADWGRPIWRLPRDTAEV